MTQPSSTSVNDASVEANGRISQININIILEYIGSPGDYVTLYEPFFDALDDLTRSAYPAEGQSPTVQVHIGTQAVRADDWHSINRSDDDSGASSPAPSLLSVPDSDISTSIDDDDRDTTSSPASIDQHGPTTSVDGPALEPPISTESSLSTVTDFQPSQSSLQTSVCSGTDIPTRINTPEGYHIIYYCATHGSQNHYGPHCDCVPTYVSVNTPPLLPDGSRAPVLPDGRIPYPPPNIAPTPTTAEENSTPSSEIQQPPDYKERDASALLAATLAQYGLDTPAAGPSNSSSSPVASTSSTNTPTPSASNMAAPTQVGPFYAVFVGVQTGVFDDWFIVAPLVVGTSGATFKKYSTRLAAQAAYERALIAGAVHIV